MTPEVESGQPGSVFEGHGLLAEDFLNSFDPDEDADYLLGPIISAVDKRVSVLDSVEQRLTQVRAALKEFQTGGSLQTDQVPT
jgi:hypothetical protein